MANVLNVIQPYWYANTWVFDDASKGLEKEPLEGRFEAELREIRALARLVGGGVTKMIDYIVKDIPNAREGFILLFSSQPFTGYQVELNRVAEEEGGCLYRAKDYNAETWLSPALFRQFETTPEALYMKAEPRCAEYDPAEMVAPEGRIEKLEQMADTLTLENDLLKRAKDD